MKTLVKKSLVWVLIFAFVVAPSFSMQVHGATDLSFTIVSNISVTRGQTVTIPITVSNNPGFVAVGLQVGFNPQVIQLTNVTAPQTAMPLNQQFALNPVQGIQWVSLVNEALVDWSGTGTVANLTFNVLSTAPVGTSPIYLSFTTLPSGVPANAAGNVLNTATTTNGSVNVSNGTQQPIIPSITSQSHTSVTHGIGGSFQVTAIGAIPISFTLNGQPSGVSINSATGLITIAATTAVGIHNFTITAMDIAESSPAQNFTLTVTQDPTVQPVEFLSINHPSSIVGLPNGTPIASLGLPGSVMIQTTDGNKWAAVQWSLVGINYNPAVQSAQSFTVWGNVILSSGVTNPQNRSLSTNIGVSVNAATIPTPTPTPTPAPTPVSIPTPSPAPPVAQPRPTVPAQIVSPEPIVHPDPVVLTFFLNGRQRSFVGQPPILTPCGTILVPVREIFEMTGWNVEWDTITETATITRGRVVVTVTNGSRQFTAFGFTRSHDNLSAQMVNGYLMIPFVQLFNNNLGARMWWNAENELHMFFN